MIESLLSKQMVNKNLVRKVELTEKYAVVLVKGFSVPFT